MNNQQPIREQLVKLLQGGQSYTPMRQLLTGIPFELAGKRVDGLPYTMYRLTEHIRITQWNVSDFGYRPLSGPGKWQVEHSYAHVQPKPGIASKPFV